MEVMTIRIQLLGYFLSSSTSFTLIKNIVIIILFWTKRRESTGLTKNGCKCVLVIYAIHWTIETRLIIFTIFLFNFSMRTKLSDPKEEHNISVYA